MAKTIINAELGIVYYISPVDKATYTINFYTKSKPLSALLAL